MAPTDNPNPTERHRLRLSDGTLVYRVTEADVNNKNRPKCTGCEWCALRPEANAKCATAICTPMEAGNQGWDCDSAVYVPADQLAVIRLTGDITRRYAKRGE